MLRALGGLVSLGLSVLSLFRISGLSILTRAQAHCSCFFRHRCGWRILASGGAGLAVEFFGVSTGTGRAS